MLVFLLFLLRYKRFCVGDFTERGVFMYNLTSINISPVVEKIISVLTLRKEIVGAYLFGSILGQCREDSDIDLGIVLTPHYPYTEKETEKIQEELIEDLPPFQNHHYDVVIVNYVSAIFAFSVISKGQLIYCGDHDVLSDFIEEVSRKRAENYPRYRRALEIIAKG